MAESIIQKAGGGAASDECTAGKAQVLAGYTAVTKDSGDEPAAGTMASNGSMDASLNCGQSKKIPAGYTPGGTVTANSLASQTGGATAEDKYVLNGKTYWKDGVKRTGGMTVASVASFSVAAYSTSQVLATWKNPSRGPYSGVAICAKTGGYPANINDGRVYTGVGSNSAVNGTSSQVIGGLAAGTTYYFRIWVYCTCSAGDQYSGYLQATCTPTAHGRKVFTSSGTFTVPAGVRVINIHCTGGGGGGGNKGDLAGAYGGGGCGGYTAYKNGISVSPGQVLSVTVGDGGKRAYSGNASSTMNGSTLLCQAAGGDAGAGSSAKGGSGGGGYYTKGGTDPSVARGGSNGGNGAGTKAGTGQGSTTKEFGTGTLYSGGGGGSRSGNGAGAPGGDGGGGSGANINNVSSAGTAGTGGGGGGGYGSENIYGSAGGSGNVIITW